MLDLWQAHYQIFLIIMQHCDCFLEYENVNGSLINYKCLSCNKNYSNKIYENQAYIQFF